MGFLRHIPTKRPSRRMPSTGHAFPCSPRSPCLLQMHPGPYQMPCRTASGDVSQPAGSHNQELWGDAREHRHSLGYHSRSRQCSCQQESKGLRFGSSNSNEMDRCLDVTGAPDRKQSAWCGGRVEQNTVLYERKEPQHEPGEGFRYRHG